MKKTRIPLLFMLCCFVGTLYSQELPTRWYRCDASSPSFQWHNTVAPGSEAFNYHAGHLIATPGEYLICDSIPRSSGYTLIVVYKPLQREPEQPLWQLHFNDSTRHSLSSRALSTVRHTIRYQKDTGIYPLEPMIHTLQQNTPKEDTVTPYYRLEIGNTGVESSRYLLAEVLYYDHRISLNSLRQVQSYLAIKYGVTLGPVDYITHENTSLWKHRTHRDYHHRIFGIGRNDYYGLSQHQSRSEHAENLLSLSHARFYADPASRRDTLSQGAFWVCGDNNAPLLSLEDPHSHTRYVERQWKLVRTQGDSLLPFSLRVEGRYLGVDPQTLVLHVQPNDTLYDLLQWQYDSGIQLYLPDSIGADSSLYYRDLIFDSDGSGSDLLAFGYGGVLTSFVSGNSNGKSQKNANTSSASLNSVAGGTTTRLYPNPTLGTYHLTLEGSDGGLVEAVIHNTLGIEVGRHTGSGKSRYHFSGSLPQNNTYYITLTTGEGTQTLKLVVR